MKWPNMTLPRYGNSAFTHYPWVSLVCLTNIFQCVSVQSCGNVILKKSGSCDHGLTGSVPVPARCISSGSDRCLRCDGKPVTARRGERIFDQLLSSNISAQCFSILRGSEVELNQTKLWGSREGLLVPDGLPPPKELHCTRNPLAQLTGSNIFHFSEPSGMHLQGLPRQKPIPWIVAKQDGSKLC